MRPRSRVLAISMLCCSSDSRAVPAAAGLTAPPPADRRALDALRPFEPESGAGGGHTATDPSPGCPGAEVKWPPNSPPRCTAAVAGRAAAARTGAGGHAWAAVAWEDADAATGEPVGAAAGAGAGAVAGAATNTSGPAPASLPCASQGWCWGWGGGHCIAPASDCGGAATGGGHASDGGADCATEAAGAAEAATWGEAGVEAGVRARRARRSRRLRSWRLCRRMVSAGEGAAETLSGVRGRVGDESDSSGVGPPLAVTAECVGEEPLAAIPLSVVGCVADGGQEREEGRGGGGQAPATGGGIVVGRDGGNAERAGPAELPSRPCPVSRGAVPAASGVRARRGDRIFGIGRRGDCCMAAVSPTAYGSTRDDRPGTPLPCSSSRCAVAWPFAGTLRGVDGVAPPGPPAPPLPRRSGDTAAIPLASTAWAAVATRFSSRRRSSRARLKSRWSVVTASFPCRVGVADTSCDVCDEALLRDADAACKAPMRAAGVLTRRKSEATAVGNAGSD